MFIIGYILTILGLFFIFLYINLLSIGYSFSYFVKFIIGNVYCDLFFIGIILLFISLERWITRELLLRRNYKLSR